MFINGKPVESYGAVMLGTPRISNAQYTPEYKYTRTRSTVRHLAYEIGMKEIECSLAFFGLDIHEIQLKRSAFRAAMLGLLDISFKGDRFFYFAEYDGDAELESEYNNAAVSKFKFHGVQHLPLKVVNKKLVSCESTIPETDCRITTVATENKARATVGTVSFFNVLEGDVLIADGIDGLITKNGQATESEFVRLPYLVRGQNTISCAFNNVSVEFYPTFL